MSGLAHLWNVQRQHKLIVIELIKSFYLLICDDHIVEDQVVDQPVLHSPQDIWHILNILEYTSSSNCYVLQIRWVIENFGRNIRVILKVWIDKHLVPGIEFQTSLRGLSYQGHSKALHLP